MDQLAFWAPQRVGAACWAGVAATLVAGLLRSNFGPDRGGKGQGVHVNEALAVVTSDLWVFAAVSSAAALGLGCAFLERAVVIDGLFGEEGRLAETTEVVHAVESVSDDYLLNLAAGGLIKSMAVANVIVDLLLARRVLPSLGQVVLDLGELVLFGCAVWLQQEMIAPAELALAANKSAAGAHRAELVFSVERLLVLVLVCACLCLTLMVLPWVRYYGFSVHAQQLQLDLAELDVRRDMEAEIAASVKSGQSKDKVEQAQEAAIVENTLETERVPAPCANQQAPAPAPTSPSRSATNGATSEPQGEGQGSGKAAQSRKPHGGDSDQGDKGLGDGQGSMDMLMGGGLCLSGLALSFVILRRLQRGR